MIISCDPPRHAMLIHFGKKNRKLWPLCLSPYEGIEIALDESQNPSKLIAIHFVRHSFYLPFINGDGFSVDYFNLSFRRGAKEVRFDFEFMPSDYEIVDVYKGLKVLLSQPQATGKDRPNLRGFKIETQVLQVEFDAEEVEFQLGIDNLKDVEVTLFVTVPRL